MRLNAAWRGLAVLVAATLMSAETRHLYLEPLWGTRAVSVLVAIAGVGLLARLFLPRGVLPSLLTWVLQGGVATWVIWVLNRGMLDEVGVRGVLADATVHIRAETAPMAASPSLSVLFLGICALFLLMIELCVFVGHSPGLSVVPLAGWYLVFALMPYPQASVGTFVAALGGYLLILAVDTLCRARLWRRGVGYDSERGGDVPATVARAALVVGVPALAAAVVIGTLLPVAPPTNRTGNGAGTTVSDPRITLRQNLHANMRNPVLTYQTSAADGQYLRMAVLSTYTEAGWMIAPFTPEGLSGTELALPAPAGLTSPLGAAWQTQVQISQLATEYLPLPFAAQRITVGQTWGVDPATLMVVATGDRSGPDRARGLGYSVSGHDVAPTADQLAAITAAPDPGGGTATLPAGFPPEVIDLARRLTVNARTPIEKVSAIQEWLRGPTFTYNLDAAPDGPGYDALREFLFTGHTGYCEQFAGAMALLTRAVGLPSRVVIGFQAGHRQGRTGPWTVTNLDMHAWPEIYFEGWGWLRFEPTPSDGRVTPGYSADVPVGDPAVPLPTPSASASPSPTQAAPTTSPSSAPTGTSRPGGGAAAGVGWVAVPLGLLALLAVPGVARALLRRRRLATPGTAGTLAAWDEARDLVLDAGGAWPSDSPRAIVAAVAPRLGRRAGAGLGELAQAVERARFAAAPGDGVEDPGAIIAAVRRDLDEGLDARERLLARVWPRSLWALLAARLRR